MARQDPAVGGIDLGRAGAAVADGLAGPEEAPAHALGRREQGLGDRREGEIAPQVEAEQPIVGIEAHAEEPEDERLGSEDGAVHAAAALRAEHRVLPPQSEEVDVESIGCAVALALAEVELRALEGEAIGRIG